MKNKYFIKLFDPHAIRYVFFLPALLFLIQFSLYAQYTPITLSGFNEDVIAEGVGVGAFSVTTNNISGDNKVLMANGFKPTPCVGTYTQYLPATSPYTSPTITGLTFEMGSFAANNCLRLGSFNQVGTLTFNTPVSASALYMMATGGSGSPQVTVTVNFTDLSSQAPLAVTILDWYQAVNAANNYVVQQVGRVTRDATSCPETNAGSPAGPNFYHYVIPILPANYSKQIASITVTGINTDVIGPIAAIFGVSAKAVCAAPTAQPTALGTSTVTTGTINGTFTAATLAPTGGYLVVRYPQGATPTLPDAGATYTAGQSLGLGTVVSTSNTTTFSATGLTGNTTYDFYVYSYSAAADCGGPIYMTSSPLSGSLATNLCAPTSGTISVPGTFATLTAAMADISTNGISGNTIIELQSGYDASLETYPIVFPSNACIKASSTLTIRPSSVVGSPIIITSANAGPTLNMTGASYVIIDGRPGGTGSTSMLQIINTNAAGTAIQFINDAHHNTITYCDLQGQNTSAPNGAAGLGGVVCFQTADASGLKGNDNNTISFCDIHSTSGGFTAFGVHSYGTLTPTAAWNDNNTITNCNIYDFFNAATATVAVKCDGGSNAFTISNNKIYQTATRTFTTGNQHRAFWLSPTAAGACGFQVLNNTIGYASNSATGTYTLLGGAVVTNYWGMDINHAGSVHTLVQGNIIANISLTNSSTTTANDLFRGISFGNSGNIDIIGNTIGSTSAAGSITLSTTGNSSVSYAIRNLGTSASTDSVVISNNTISGITVSSTTATNAASLNAIGVTSGTYTAITGNTIGYPGLTNSLNCSNAATTIQNLYGINVTAGTTTIANNNTISNLNNGYVSTSTGYTRGISITTSTATTISGNTVRNLSSASTYTGSGASAALVGIVMNTPNPATVTDNVIDSLVLVPSITTAASFVEGLVFGSNGSFPTNIVSRNFVHSLSVINNDSASTIVGIDILGGANIITNNMIRLGIQPDGTDLITSATIRGLYLNTTTSTNIFHNSVYIGGTGVNLTTASRNSMAFYRNASGTHDLRNNIFINNRSNSTTGGKHYQLFLNNTTGLTIGNNIYNGTGTGSVFATLNGGTSDVAGYASGWITADVNSTVNDPKFINVTGEATSSTNLVDMHISGGVPTPVENAGVNITSVTTDFDNTLRSTNTPVDIGADAGNFVAMGMEVNSTLVDQTITKVASGSTNQVILGIRMFANNNNSPLQVSSFLLTTAGSGNALTDINTAKVYFTGNNATFSTANLYGSSSAPNGAFTISGAATLTTGVNYFWVTYDMKATATPANLVDARVTNITLTGGANPNIANGDPAGARQLASPLHGNYNIGASGDYTTMNAAFNDLASVGVSAPVTLTLIDPTYTLTDSVAVKPFAGGSAVNTVTLLPLNVGTTITSSSAASTFEINGVSYFIIDGRPGATGSIVYPNTDNLKIINSATSGIAIRINNESHHNVIRYCDLQGANNVNANLGGAPAGVVFIGASSGSNGNDNNTIDNCHIHSSNSSNVLTMGVYSYGPSASATITGAFNDSNIVSNCNIYDIYGGAALSTGGVVVDKGNNAWTISGNHFFQSVASRTPVLTVGITNRNIYLAPANSGVGNGFTVTGNYIGGTAPGCGGSAFISNSTGSFNNLFEGITLNVAGGTASNIRGNIISNINISQGAATGDIMHAIWLTNNGNVNIGGPLAVHGNIVGSDTSFLKISLTSGSPAPSHMIGLASTAGANSSTVVTIQNNKVGAITATSAGSSVSGIFCNSSATLNILQNLVGSTTYANSINISNNTTTAQFVRGINIPSGAAVLTISNNIIANLNNNGTATGATTNGSTTLVTQTEGIHIISTSATGPVVTSNTIKDLSSASPTTGPGTASTVVGIAVFNTTASTAANISANTIDSLVATSASTSAALVASGLTYSGPTTVFNILSKNYINNIDVSAVNTNALIKGIEILGGTSTVANNMVRLGLRADGSDLATSLAIGGIVKNTGTNNRFYHNSVYIGGNVSGTIAKNSAAFQRVLTGVDDIRNNIFVNSRVNAATGGKHYQLLLNANATLTVNNNVYFGTGAGSVFSSADGGTNDNVNYVAGWISGDVNSIAVDPQFINPAGPSATADLHISLTTATPVESSGTLIASITDDIDGASRSSLTPVDIGADAGNFMAQDVLGPIIGTVNATNTSILSDRTITVTISDYSGVATGGGEPRLYYYKSSGGMQGAYNTATGTLVSGTAFSGQWSFVLSSTAMLSLATNDSVYFYIAAQDASSGTYLSSSPAGASGVLGGTPPPSLFSYRIVNGYAGNINVGGANPFTSLSAVGGIFDSINKGSVSGNITITITSDLLAEDGSVALNQWTESGSGNYKVTIVPDAAAERLIAGTATANALIRFNGADRVRVDGSFAGSGRYLRFRNRSTTGGTFMFINDAHRDTITSCIIEGVSSTGNIIFSTTNIPSGSGNDSNGVMNCAIRDTVGSIIASTRPAMGINSTGTTGFENSENTFSNNEIYNFTGSGIGITATGNGSNWMITGNSFYYNFTNPATTAQSCISVVPGAASVNNWITGNYIGGSAANCGGTYFANYGNIAWRGIVVNAGVTDSSYVRNNTIQNIQMGASSTGGTFAAIELGGGLLSVNQNTIGHASTAASIIINIQGTSSGILFNGATAVGQVYNNLIANIKGTAPASASTFMSGIRLTSINTEANQIIRNNTIRDMVATSTSTATATPALSGINTIVAGTIHTILNNTVYNLTNNGLAATLVAGINVASTSASGNINANTIYGLNNNSNVANALIAGIHLDNSNTLAISNNMIALGAGVDSLAIISGIMDKSTGVSNNIYFNSVLISGSSSTAAATLSYAYRRTTNSTTDIRNNIFSNTRNGGTFNYAIANLAGTLSLGWASDANAYNANNAASIATWGGPAMNFVDWKSYSGGDILSASYAAVFVSSTNLHLAGTSVNNQTLAGIPISGFATDFDGQTRDLTKPYMGADENTNFPLPVKLVMFTATSANNTDVLVSWRTASEINNAGFEVLRSLDGKHFDEIGFVKGKGTPTLTTNYTLADNKAFDIAGSNTLYYMLKQVDMDGKVTYSNAVLVSRENKPAEKLVVSPNPFNADMFITLTVAKADDATVQVMDIQGKVVATFSQTLFKGVNNIHIDGVSGLQSGVYFVKLITTNNTFVSKVIKE